MGADFRATAGGDGIVTVDSLVIGTTALSSAELLFLDGVTAGTVTASKAVVVDSNKRIDTIVIATSGLKIGTGAGTAMDCTAAELNKLNSVTGGTTTASKALVVDANSALSNLAFPVSGIKIGAAAGTAMDCTAAELNKLNGVTAGTTTASKAIVVDANSATSVLALPVSGLKIGAGAGTAVDCTAVELNKLNAVVAGTTSASKALVVGANKETDVLALPVSGLKIGAGAGTAVDRTAAEINLLTQSVAAGYKVARSASPYTPVSASDTIVTGLATVVSVIVEFASAPTLNHMWNIGDIGNQAGAPAAGSFLLKSKKPTGSGDVTPTDTTASWVSVNWFAIGT